jgi:hypothetical protein
MANKNFSIAIEMGLKGQNWSLHLISSEEAIINMLLSAYGVFEEKIRELARTPSGRAAAPADMIEDAFVLLRCLVLRRLEEHRGKFVSITRVLK